MVYLGSTLESTLLGDDIGLKALGKINGRLNFLYRKQGFLTPSLKRLLCNALIQPHFDFACLAWYTNLQKKLKKKVQISQNKCIRFCLNMENRDHIGVDEFRKINWLPTKERFEQCLLVNIYKFFNKMAPVYYDEMYYPAVRGQSTRFSFQKLILPSRCTNRGLRTLGYLGPRLWNGLHSGLKLSSDTNTFKHKIKDAFFARLQKEEDSPYIYY